MKKLFILLMITVGFYTGYAQEFKATEKYTLMNERSAGGKESGSMFIDLVASNDTSMSIATLTIAEVKSFQKAHITLLTNPKLEGVEEILKVEFHFSATCSSSDTYYFLVRSATDFIALPALENQYCEHPNIDQQYIFPSQKHGREGTILRTEFCYTAANKIKNVAVLQSFYWNDDDFDSEEAILATNELVTL